MCILYALLSSHSKNRFAPYQTPGQLLFQLFQPAPPSITQRFCAGVRSRNGTSSGTPSFAALFSRSRWLSMNDFDWKGLIAPSPSVLRSSGITSP